MHKESLKEESDKLMVGPEMDNSGIKEEIQAELEELKKELCIAKPIEEIVNLEIAFYLSSEKPLIISGVALAEGIWKNTIYSADELKKACNDLVGKPVKVEHGNDKEFGDRIVGKVVLAEWDDLLKAIKFKAEITDPKAIEYIKQERFKAVSMSTWMEKIPTGVGELKVGQNFKFVELSLVENPACEKCFIFHVEQLSKMEKSLKDSKKEEKVGELIMSEDNSVKELLVALCEEGDFLEEVQLSSETELEELQKTKKVIAYYYISPYYGYPYPYYGYPYYGYPCYPYYGYPYYPYGFPGIQMSKKVTRKSKKLAGEPKAVGRLVVESNDTIEIFETDNEEELKKELENAKAAAKKIIAYYYYPIQYYPYYGYPYYGYPYYGYPYGYPCYPYKPMKEEEETLPFEETEETIKCRACGKEFSNFKDFIAHWVQEHRQKYGPYKPIVPYYGYPAYGYPAYGYPEMKKEDQLEDVSEDEDILAGDFKIVFNKRNKKWIVFQVPEKGLWKIVGVFDTEEEAKDFIAKQSKEEKAEETGKQPQAQNESQPTQNELINNGSQLEVKPEINVDSNQILGGDVMEEKKDVQAEGQVQEKKEEKQEAPKEEVKPEASKEEPKTEAPKVEEEKKEEPKVETPKVEAKVEQPKVETTETKEPPKEEKITVEDILKIIKEHPEAKRLILEKWFEEKKTGRS